MDIGRHGNIGQTRGAVNPAFSALAKSPPVGHRSPTFQVNPGPAPFRLNLQVVQMIAVVFLALAVPLALVVLGGREIFFRKPSSPAPEVPELRASLESAASKALPPPAGLGGGRRFILESGASTAAHRDTVEKTAAELGGVVVESPLADGVRLIVQIPTASASRFEETALVGFLAQSEAALSTPGFYEIVFPHP
jgi:hypothetical protein